MLHRTLPQMLTGLLIYHSKHKCMFLFVTLATITKTTVITMTTNITMGTIKTTVDTKAVVVTMEHSSIHVAILPSVSYLIFLFLRFILVTEVFRFPMSREIIHFFYINVCLHKSGAGTKFQRNS